MERILCNLLFIQPADRLPMLMHQSRDPQKGAGEWKRKSLEPHPGGCPPQEK